MLNICGTIIEIKRPTVEEDVEGPAEVEPVALPVRLLAGQNGERHAGGQRRPLFRLNCYRAVLVCFSIMHLVCSSGVNYIYVFPVICCVSLTCFYYCIYRNFKLILPDI